MSADIALALLAFLSQFLTAYLGWRITIDPVQARRKRLYKVLFLFGGLVGAISIVLAAYRASGVATNLATLKAGQKQTNAGISRIQENQAHQPSVTVNVPPAAKTKGNHGAIQKHTGRRNSDNSRSAIPAIRLGCECVLQKHWNRCGCKEGILSSIHRKNSCSCRRTDQANFTRILE